MTLNPGPQIQDPESKVLTCNSVVTQANEKKERDRKVVQFCVVL